MDMAKVSLADQIAEVKREIKMRMQVYSKLVDGGRMKAEEAEKRTINMAAVLRTLEGINEKHPS